MKIPEPRRNSGAPKQRIEKFISELESTFPFWPRNPFVRIQKEEDKSFLLSMIGDRKATMAGFDRSLTVTEKKVAIRKEKEKLREEKEKKREKEEIKSTGFENLNVEEEVSNEFQEDEFTIPEVHKIRSRKTGTDIHIPYDILKSPKLVSSSVRNGISPRALAATVEALIDSCNGVTSGVNLHETQSQRYRLATITNIAEQIKENWSSANPAVNHWDGKLMETIQNKHLIEDCLPFLIWGVGGVKLLGVPALPVKSSESSGSLISSATVYLKNGTVQITSLAWCLIPHLQILGDLQLAVSVSRYVDHILS